MSVNKYYINLLVFTVILLYMSSCGDKDEHAELPEYVVDRETFTSIITDMHLVEAALVEKQQQGLLSFDLSEIYYDSLFASYAVTKIEVDSSISYYSRNPALYDAIYVNVITNLSKIESTPAVMPDTLPGMLSGPDAAEEMESDTIEFSDPVWFPQKSNPWMQ